MTLGVDNEVNLPELISVLEDGPSDNMDIPNLMSVSDGLDSPDLLSVSKDGADNKSSLSDLMSTSEDEPESEEERTAHPYDISTSCLFSDPVERWFKQYLEHTKKSTKSLLDQEDTKDYVLRMLELSMHKIYKPTKDILILWEDCLYLSQSQALIELNRVNAPTGKYFMLQ